jgi:hypothetical protein
VGNAHGKEPISVTIQAVQFTKIGAIVLATLTVTASVATPSDAD